MERPNIVLTGTCRRESYTAPSRVIKTEVYPRSRDAHAARLAKELKESLVEEDGLREMGIVTREGTYLEFAGPQDDELVVGSLENKQLRVRLLNVRQVGDSTHATVYVPQKRREYFPSRIEQYARENTKGSHPRPKNERLVTSIESIRIARVEAFWTDDLEGLPRDERKWVEAWIRTDEHHEENAESDFASLLEDLGIRCSGSRIRFPERTVLLLHANLSDLEKLINQSDLVAELRSSTTPTSFYESLEPREQREWIDELLGRTSFERGKSVVCVLDTGLNQEHWLISPMVSDHGVQTVNDAWGTADRAGHGTPLAGIALYGNLKAKLDSSDTVKVTHGLESVKIYEPSSPTRDESLYGDIAQQAMSRAAAANAESRRVYCSAVTAGVEEVTDGLPNSWSAAVDEAISHAEDPEIEDGELFLVSAGNVTTQMLEQGGYPDTNLKCGVRSPGQSWNALTVGAYCENDIQTEREIIDAGYVPLAQHGELSPYSTTSRSWEKSGVPVKPEIVCAGGNVVTNGTDYSNCSDLSCLSTGANLLTHPLVQFNATSAAVAQAAWMAAELEDAYPDLWPETVRALMVHSARWTEQMKRQFIPDGRMDSPKKGRRDMLRSCGYGVPSLERAIGCRSNSVNLVIQETMQPYQMAVGSDGSRHDAMKDINIHVIPWPSEVLQDLGNARAVLHVTLSYYIEPSPGRVGWKNKYTYASHGLRFDVNNPGETFEELSRRLNVGRRPEGEDRYVRGSKGWYLGAGNRDVGSMHSDYKHTTAIELSDIRYVAVYPVIGWWRKRSYLGRIDSRARYSLIVSIETPESDVDLYTAIRNKVEVEQYSGIVVR